jgi:cytochrome c-type biogenesis protein CcmH/NrfG
VGARRFASPHHLQAEQVAAAAAELERAARLLPERGEAWARLAQLATSANSERT